MNSTAARQSKGAARPASNVAVRRRGKPWRRSLAPALPRCLAHRVRSPCRCRYRHPKTKQYNMPFYLQYLTTWPEYFLMKEAPDGTPMGYSELRNAPPLKNRLFCPRLVSCYCACRATKACCVS